MGRGRSGIITVSTKRKGAQGKHSDVRFVPNNHTYTHVCSFTREQIEVLKHLSNEQLAAAILSPAARPSTPREQTPASGHRAGSTQQAHVAS